MYKLSEEELKRKFVEYNHLYFEDEIRMPVLFLHNGKPYGEFKNKPRKTISISMDVQWTEDGLRNILLHEMIHCVNCQRKHYENFHGKFFKVWQRKIYREHHIKIKTHYSELFINENPPRLPFLRMWWYIKRHFLF